MDPHVPHAPLTRRFAPPSPARREGKQAARRGVSYEMKAALRVSPLPVVNLYGGRQASNVVNLYGERQALIWREQAECDSIPGEGGTLRSPNRDCRCLIH
jgi:hypothetical protein